MNISTLHEYCTDEYTLTAMLAGTYSVAVVPGLQGGEEVSPKALLPIALRLFGRMMLDKLPHSVKTSLPIV